MTILVGLNMEAPMGSAASTLQSGEDLRLVIWLLFGWLVLHGPVTQRAVEEDPAYWRGFWITAPTFPLSTINICCLETLFRARDTTCDGSYPTHSYITISLIYHTSYITMLRSWAKVPHVTQRKIHSSPQLRGTELSRRYRGATISVVSLRIHPLGS